MSDNNQTPRKPCILLVDDSRVVRKSLIRILEADFELVEAANGAAAWTALANDSRIDLVITDIEMPELDGYGLICRIRAVEDPGLRDVPIVVITSAEDEVTRDRAYACGANDFILKPLHAAQLQACLKTQLADYQAATDAAGVNTTDTAPADDVVVPSTRPGSLKDAVAHLDAGLKILSSLNTAAIAPHALALMLRLMPLLKYCNTRFGLGMDHEVAVFHERLKNARRPAPASRTGTG